MGGATTLERRLANFRAGLARAEVGPVDGAVSPKRGSPRADHAERLAAAIGGEVVRSERGAFVRLEHPGEHMPLDRERLARLPGQPPSPAPLVCLDTETTGLGTAAGNYAFLVGLGWWAADRFVQVQLLLPDQPDEAALLEEIARLVPADGWLVTYNGRGFDWPLLVTRFRMARRDAPWHAGHLDLLPLVRRLFRHRMADARLKTVEEELLGLRRHGDVEGWEIPGRYLAFLRGESAEPLVEVIAHNAEDVRSLARLLAHVEQGYADSAAWPKAPPGDLRGLAAAFGTERRHEEALACLDAALEGKPPDRGRRTWTSILTTRADDGFGIREPIDDGWTAADQARRRAPRPPVGPGTERHRLIADRARILRRLGRVDEALESWRNVALAGGAGSAAAWVEVAKLLEHRRRDADGALAATRQAIEVVERCRVLGRPTPRLEAELALREQRLRRRIGRRRHAGPPADRGQARRSGLGSRASETAWSSSW